MVKLIEIGLTFWKDTEKKIILLIHTFLQCALNLSIMLLVITAVLMFSHPVLTADFNLLEEVRPFHYDIKFIFDLDPKNNFSFFGVVNIWVTASVPTKKILLHAQDFEVDVDRVVLNSRKQLAPAVADVQLKDKYQFLEVSLDSAMEVNVNYTLVIPFYGNLKQGLDGIYVSTYQNKTTKDTEYVIATQFEAITARKGFPCFDEPSYKASFRITIGHPVEYLAISNMPVRKSSRINALVKQWPWNTVEKAFKKPQSRFVWDHFMRSAPMSTYLVALVVSKFTCSHSASVGTAFRTCTRDDAIDETEFASSIGPKVLTYFEKYYDLRYPLPKLDMVAIPDFYAGAMENWGLVIYSERALLYDKKESTLADKLKIIEVIAHELAHQWFGNLVTMKWWSDLWLNEGFATQAALGGMAAVMPGGPPRDAAPDADMLHVFAADSLPSSRPVSSPIEDIDHISTIFDDIAYKKGAVLIRMMSLIMGENHFKKAINRYLTKYAYSNAASADLWQELSTETGTTGRGAFPAQLSVHTLMTTWTRQPGYPLLTVTRRHGTGTVAVTQRRYLALETNKTSSNLTWWIPTSVLSNGRTELRWIPPEGDPALKVDGGENDWILFNPDMMTLMRVNYDEDNWDMLISTLNSERYGDVPVSGRVQLLADAFELAWNNRLDYSKALKLAFYLERETDLLPLRTGLECLSKIEGVIMRTKDYGAFQKYMRKLITKPYKMAGGLSIKTIINEDDLHSVQKQTLTSEVACRMQVPGCEEHAIELYRQWMEEPNPDQNNPIPLDLRRLVYCVALGRGGVAAWRFAVARRRRATSPSSLADLTAGLACTNHVWLLNTYLEWSVSNNSEIRRQDAMMVIINVLKSPGGYYIAREFVYTRIEEIALSFADQQINLGIILKYLLLQITKRKDLEEFQKWSEENQKYLTPIKKMIELGVENTRVNLDWMDRHSSNVVHQMREYTSNYEDPMCKLFNKSSRCDGVVNKVLISLCTSFSMAFLRYNKIF